MPETDQYKFSEGETLLFDKPKGWTSFDVVNKVKKTLRWAFKQKIKVGHAGTLDPLATGLLILCTGRFTKNLADIQAEEKEYTGIITIGATTPSFDLEQEVDETFPTNHITKQNIRDIAAKFHGEQIQEPPIFSARKIEGVRSYKHARKGRKVKVRKTLIEVMEFDIVNVEFHKETIDVYFRIVCSKGTYIRSIARDLGKALNSGAHLKELRRTRSGNYHVKDAMSVEDFSNIFRDWQG